MDPPTGIHPGDVRDEKFQVFKAIRPLAPEDVVRGQAGEGGWHNPVEMNILG